MSRLTIFIFVCCVVGGCGRSDHGKVTIVLLGQDSMSCYYESSGKRLDIQDGRLSDAVFVSRVLGKLANQSSAIVVKPTFSGNVREDMETVRGLLKQYKVKEVEWQLNSLVGGERTVFDRVSVDPEPEELDSFPFPVRLRLMLPKEDDKPFAVGAKDLVIIPYADAGIYCYSGPDIRSGKKYKSDELRRFLTARNADTNFRVIIRPSVTCTYKGTVDMLDMMKLSGVKKYELVDITKSEEEYIRQIVINPGARVVVRHRSRFGSGRLLRGRMFQMTVYRLVS